MGPERRLVLGAFPSAGTIALGSGGGAASCVARLDRAGAGGSGCLPVLDHFGGRRGRASPETNEERTDRETVIRDLLDGRIPTRSRSWPSTRPRSGCATWRKLPTELAGDISPIEGRGVPPSQWASEARGELHADVSALASGIWSGDEKGRQLRRPYAPSAPPSAVLIAASTSLAKTLR
jgi:hypothetical protein